MDVETIIDFRLLYYRNYFCVFCIVCCISRIRSHRGTYYSDALFYISLGLYRIAPLNQNIAILLDCDLYFKKDIGLLFNEFDTFRGHLGDQDFYTLVGNEYPHLIQTLNCKFNRQLCTWWRDHGYSNIFEHYFKCNHDIVVLHGIKKNEVTCKHNRQIGQYACTQNTGIYGIIQLRQPGCFQEA
ncbi:hypothetical protein JTB14_012704 [Gonioctena quinquepunctata]|nr:hypothetical protein JTB14_012704 [Gonioctena quinquepunctata]